MENGNCAPPLSFLSSTRPGHCLSKLIFNHSQCGNEFTSREKSRARQAFEASSGLRLGSLVGSARAWNVSRIWFSLVSWGILFPALILIGLVLLLLAYTLHIHHRMASMIYILAALAIYTGILFVRAGAEYVLKQKVRELETDFATRRENIEDSLPNVINGIMSMSCALTSGEDEDYWRCGNIKPDSSQIGGPL